VTKLFFKRYKTENILAKTLDSKVGFMRVLGGPNQDMERPTDYPTSR